MRLPILASHWVLLSLTLSLIPGVKFRRQHWLFLLICLLVFVIILSIYLPIASRADDIEVWKISPTYLMYIKELSPYVSKVKSPSDWSNQVQKKINSVWEKTHKEKILLFSSDTFLVRVFDDAVSKYWLQLLKRFLTLFSNFKVFHNHNNYPAVDKVFKIFLLKLSHINC